MVNWKKISYKLDESSDSFKIALIIYLPSLFVDEFSLSLSPDSAISPIIMNRLASSKKPTFSAQSAFQIAMDMNIYDRISEKFINGMEPIKNQNIPNQTFLIASFIKDNKALNDKFRIRKKTVLDKMAKGIFNGE